MADQHVIAGLFAVGLVDAQAGRGVALGIEIDQQDAKPGGGQPRGQIDGSGGFSDAALLIGDGNTDHPRPFLLTDRTACATMMALSASVTLRSTWNAPCHDRVAASSSLCAFRPFCIRS